MKTLKYWYISRHPETNEIQFNINLPKQEKDITFEKDENGWILKTSYGPFSLVWENNYRELHSQGCFCNGECIFVSEAKLIDNIFLSREETTTIINNLCTQS